MAEIVSATETGLAAGSKILATAKAAVLSPAFGAAALIGIIAFEWWKGSRDAKKFAAAEKTDS